MLKILLIYGLITTKILITKQLLAKVKLSFLANLFFFFQQKYMWIQKIVNIRHFIQHVPKSVLTLKEITHQLKGKTNNNSNNTIEKQPPVFQKPFNCYMSFSNFFPCSNSIMYSKLKTKNLTQNVHCTHPEIYTVFKREIKQRSMPQNGCATYAARLSTLSIILTCTLITDIVTSQ